MTRRGVLGALAGGAVWGAAKRPNILLVMTDDQGWGDLGLHGNPHLKTPHLDRIGIEGAQFTRFHCSPVCSPTRSSLLTGRYNYRTGVVDTYLGRSMMHSEEVTLAEMLRPLGYRTGIFGKWHLGDNYPLRAMDQGFDESLVLNGGGLLQPGDPPEAITGVKPSYFDPLLSRNGKWERTRGYCTDVYVNEAMRFMEKSKDKPFFCYLPTNAPHTPLQVEDRYAAKYRAAGLDDTTARVYGMVENIDENMGRMLEFLKAKDLERDTIVVFLTDNGPQQKRYNGVLRELKGSAYEGGTRVPLLVRWPGKIAPGTLVDRVSAHYDLTPTLLEAAGGKTSAKMDGRSLLPLLTEPRSAGSWSDRTVYLQWHRGDAPEPFRNSAVHTQRYKLVNGTELYDMDADPGETKDLSAMEPNTVRQLRKSYEAWYGDVKGTRIFAPPRIVIGRRAPTLLTRQDWRGEGASWDAKGVGHWEVRVEAPGPYAVTLLFDAPAAATTLETSLLGRHAIAAGQTKLVLDRQRLPLGAARFEARVDGRGIQYAYLEAK